ncbi:MAG: class I SAM-dependent methyltransferase [Deltaproteobacteria bacterium]|nr:class I SAM-dependent methyltransferase [Deltaproteobacteria bacterium]
MSIKEIFNAGADQYDRQRRMVIPCFNDFYQTAIDLIPFNDADSFKFLDLGAGTGLLTAFIISAFPKATVTLMDLSEKMLEKARERFSLNKRVNFLVWDYSHSILPEEYDLIASAMSIHHLSGNEKKSLYQRAFDALKREGAFINADLVKGETDNIEQKYQDMWMNWIQEAGLSKNELLQIFDRMQYDKPSSLDIQLQWLKEIGFQDVDCYYKYFNFAVYSGRKEA